MFHDCPVFTIANLWPTTSERDSQSLSHLVSTQLLGSLGGHSGCYAILLGRMRVINIIFLVFGAESIIQTKKVSEIIINVRTAGWIRSYKCFARI